VNVANRSTRRSKLVKLALRDCGMYRGRSRVLSIVLALTFFWAATPIDAQPALVLLVRHAEKAATPADDPPLTADGLARATALVDVVKLFTATGGKVVALYASEARRTKETLQPLATDLGVPVSLIPAADGKELVKRLLSQAGGIAVVAGHSNTLPEIIRALGGKPDIVIGQDEFNRIFALRFPASGPVQLVVLTYGKSTK
jgi:phosphohistidine phosphatase SixA